MHNTISIQILDTKAERLLHHLEDLQLIRVLAKSTQPKQKLSEGYAGKLPSAIAEGLRQHIAEGRNQWKERSI